mgnify:CR=1 FL=1
MSSLVIEGGHRLEGRVAVEGNKNAALPLLAACLLTRQECVLTNVPRIGDVEVMARLLADLGAEVSGIGTTTLRVRADDIRRHEADRTLVGRLRGSVLLLAPLLARTGRARLAPPGGDFPARRSISTHLEALGAMGGPALKPSMQRSATPRSSGPWAERSRSSRRAAARFCAVSVSGGMRPSGGSMTRDERFVLTTFLPKSHQKSL